MYSIPINVLVPEPIVSVVTSLLLVAGLLFPGYLINKRFNCSDREGMGIFGYVLILTGLINSAIYLTVQLHLSDLLIFRITGILIMLSGLTGIIYAYRKIRINPIRYQTWFKSLPLYFKLITFLIAVLCFAYFLLSQSPLTDADSLDYHMGFPVVHLFYGYDLPMFDWFHSRLFGIGESLNFIGLSAWTDHLSSALQYFALAFLVFVIFHHLRNLNTNPQLLLFPIIILLGVPVLLHLISSQKSELLGNLAILYALSVLVLKDTYTKPTLFISVGSLVFAMSIKYSFYVTALFPLIYIGWNAWRNGLFKEYLGYSLMFYFLLIFPLHLFNFMYYGNPVSPLFAEFFNENGSRELSVFASFLKEYSYKGFQFPLSLLLPKNPGSISTVLGAGLFAFLFLDYRKRRSIELVIVGLLTFIFTAIFVQQTSRFFLDAYLIFMLAYVVHPVKRKGFSVIFNLLVFQVVVILFSALFGVYTQFPGSLTKEGREKTLKATASYYPLSKYLDDMLPPKSFILTDFRDNVYHPRNFITVNYPFMIHYYPEEFILRIKNQYDKECFYIANCPLDSLNILYDAVTAKEPCVKPVKLHLATRNPFNNMGVSYDVFIYKLDTEKLQSIAESYYSNANK